MGDVAMLLPFQKTTADRPRVVEATQEWVQFRSILKGEVLVEGSTLSLQNRWNHMWVYHGDGGGSLEERAWRKKTQKTTRNKKNREGGGAAGNEG